MCARCGGSCAGAARTWAGVRCSASCSAWDCAGRCAAARPEHTDLALDVLEQGLYFRGGDLDGLLHHNDRGTQYLSIRYTERLAEAGIEPSVGSVAPS